MELIRKRLTRLAELTKRADGAPPRIKAELERGRHSYVFQIVLVGEATNAPRAPTPSPWIPMDLSMP